MNSLRIIVIINSIIYNLNYMIIIIFLYTYIYINIDMFRESSFVNTAEYLEILRDSPKIYKPNDFPEILSEIDTDEIRELTESLKLNYKNVVNSTLNDVINNFGNISSSDIVNFTFDDFLDENYDSYDTNDSYRIIKTVIAAANNDTRVYWKEIPEICRYDYKFPLLSLPIFWQEIIILIYMSFKLHKHVKNDSRVIALGESPLKLVFIQQVFCTSPLFSKILTDNEMANDIGYSYFSISKLGLLVDTKAMLKTDVSFDIDKYIKMNNKNGKFSKINKNTLDYFVSAGLDPLFIITNNKKIYFQDRCEFYRTIIALMFVYSKLCDMQHLTEADRLILYQNIYIIGFDSKLEDTHPLIIDRINNLIYRIITQNITYTSGEDIHFININFRSERDDHMSFCVDNNFSMFTNQFIPIDKMIRFLSLPEKSTFNKSRCAKSINISEKINIDSEMMNNNKFQKGEQCNIINACIMIFIYELGVDYISNIVKNLDNISEDNLLHNTSIDFDSIDIKIKERLVMTLKYFENMKDGSDEEGTDYNQNIFNNILLINQMKVIIIMTIMEFISEHGVFSKCTYVLPLKTDDVSGDVGDVGDVGDDGDDGDGRGN